MKTLHLSPQDPAFVQDPYAAYRRIRAHSPLCHWAEYGMPAVFDAATVQALLRDRRLGRAVPPKLRQPVPAHLAAFDAVERHSMLELEGPAHTRLRGLVLRAFTSRRVHALAPDIEQICDDLIAAFPERPFDLIPAYCRDVPVRIIARLLGVPETAGPELLAWSNAMVAMYQSGRTRQIEEAADRAAAEFSAFLEDHIAHRRKHPADDLLSHLIAAEQDGAKLTRAEMIGTCILLLNAGHEATVHTLGNGIKALLEHASPVTALAPAAVAATVEEILRFDPPLHVFSRYVYEDIDVHGETLPSESQVALVLGSAGRDPGAVPQPDRFDPARVPAPHAAFGAGAHFCLGAPLARLEMQIALARLFARHPRLRLSETPRYAPTYHFHGLTRLMVDTAG